MSSLDQIRQSIDARLGELDNEIAALQAARAALHATSPEPPRRRTAPAARNRRRARGARSRKATNGHQALLAGKLEAMLSESASGLSASTISRRSNAAYNQVRDLLGELESTGRIRRSGTRRTTLWRLISEEELIAERAAELEQLSRARHAG